MSKKLPSVTSDIPRDLRMFLDRLREVVSGGGPDRFVSLSDLTSAGIASTDGAGNVTSPVGAVFTPPAPTGLVAVSAIRNVILNWDAAQYNGHAYTEVWGASSDNIGQAVLLGMTPGDVYADELGPGLTRYYWIRFVNILNVTGSYNAVSGVSASTPADLAYTMDVLADAYGSTSAAPFFQLDTATTIGGVSIPAGTYMKAAFIYDAAITNAKIANLAVDNAKIADLTVNKLTTGEITASTTVSSSNYLAGTRGWRINGDGNAEFSNAVVRGTVYASAGQFTGEVISQGSGGNKARMYSGNFEIYKDVPSVGNVLYKALSRTETGVGQNNVQVTIPGYFTSQPKIIVSPANIKLYDAAYSNQSQSIQCEAQNISESSAGSMVWRFTPKATLSLAANTGQTVINEASGSLSSGWTSGQYTTAANTSAVTLNVTLRSYRGTGTSGNYYYRTARWKAQYWNGSAWVDSAWSTTNFGADTAANVTTSITITFPSSGTWIVRAVTEAYDTNGTTFNTGTSYEYATDNVSRNDYQSVTANAPPGETLTLNYTPSYSVPSGWSVVSSSFTYSYTSSISYYRFGGASISGGNGYFPVQTNYSGSATYTGGLSLSFTVRATLGSFGDGGYAQLNVSSLTGTVSRRRALTNSTTAVNSFSLNYYNFNLSSSQVLAEGSLNWVALGE
jgi:hypothetical protein